MVVITAPSEAIRLVVDMLREAPGAIIGGFLAYVAHESYHALWRRPGHLLIRRILRRTRKDR